MWGVVDRMFVKSATTPSDPFRHLGDNFCHLCGNARKQRGSLHSRWVKHSVVTKIDVTRFGIMTIYAKTKKPLITMTYGRYKFWHITC